LWQQLSIIILNYNIASETSFKLESENHADLDLHSIFCVKEDKFNTREVDTDPPNYVDSVNIGMPREMPMQTQIRGSSSVSSSSTTILPVKHLSNLSQKTILILIFIAFLCKGRQIQY